MRKIWINQKLRQLGIWSIYILVGGLGFLAYYKWVSKPFGIGDILVTGALVILFALGLFKAARVIGQLFMGSPKPGRTPEETVRKFFNSTMVAKGRLDLAWVRSEAMFTLSPIAIDEINGWAGFKEHWTKRNKEILQELKKECAPDPIDKTLFEIQKIKGVGDYTQPPAKWKIIMNFSATADVGSSLNSPIVMGPWSYQSVCHLEKIEKFWYIMNPKMTLERV